MIAWQTIDTIKIPGGREVIRLATHEVDGVKTEFSMHDETVRETVPKEVWISVASLRITKPDEWVVSVLGFGKPSDPSGNLMMFRINHPSPLPSPGSAGDAHLKTVCLMLRATMASLGITPDQNAFDLISKN